MENGDAWGLQIIMIIFYLIMTMVLYNVGNRDGFFAWVWIVMLIFVICSCCMWSSIN